MNVSGIYQIINKVNNKRYIGKAKNIRNRWDRHINNLELKKHKNKHLQSSWWKYEKGNFEFLIIEICEYDNQYLNEREKYWIKFYESNNNKFGYNKTEGGDGGVINEECLKKLREVNKGNKYRLGKTFSKKTKMRLSEVLSETLHKWWQNDEYRDKMSNQSKELWQDSIYREKQSKARRKVSNEQVILVFKETLLEKSNKVIADKFNLSTTMVSNIRNKKGWYGEVINENIK